MGKDSTWARETRTLRALKDGLYVRKKNGADAPFFPSKRELFSVAAVGNRLGRFGSVRSSPA